VFTTIFCSDSKERVYYQRVFVTNEDTVCIEALLKQKKVRVNVSYCSIMRISRLCSTFNDVCMTGASAKVN